MPRWHELGQRSLAFPHLRNYNELQPRRERRGKPVLWQLMERSVTLRMDERGQQASTDAQVNGEATEQVEQAVSAEQAAPAEQSLMQELLSNPSHDYRALKYGDVIDGTIMQRDRDEFLIVPRKHGLPGISRMAPHHVAAEGFTGGR